MKLNKSTSALLLVIGLTPVLPISAIAGEIDTVSGSDAASIELTAQQIDITKVGSIDAIMQTSPAIDASVSVTDVVVDYEVCASSSLGIEGKWMGTFQCTNFGTSSDPLQPIELVISRNADGSYHYEDRVAAYDGQLCGNKLKFSGGATGDFTESGTFVFSSSSSSTKTSSWNGIPPRDMGGTCAYMLQKI